MTRTLSVSFLLSGARGSLRPPAHRGPHRSWGFRGVPPSLASSVGPEGLVQSPGRLGPPHVFGLVERREKYGKISFFDPLQQF